MNQYASLEVCSREVNSRMDCISFQLNCITVPELKSQTGPRRRLTTVPRYAPNPTDQKVSMRQMSRLCPS
jgi:hypothetical protein